jgi:hypothetical protein
MPVHSTRELATTFIGNVWMDGIGKGPNDLVRERVAALTKSRPKIDGSVFRSEVLRTLFESEESLALEPQNVTRSANEIKWEGEGGVPLRIECIGEGAPQILFAHEHGIDGAKRSGVFAALRETGLPFGMIDVRGTGISAPGGTEDNNAFLAPLLGDRRAGLGRLVLHQGRSLIGMRTIDLLAASRVLNSQPLDLLVEGGLGFAAIFAAFLSHSAYRRTIVYRTPVSCAELATATERMYNFAYFPFGILERFDLPDVTAAIPEGKLLWINPANGSGSVLQPGAAKKIHTASNVVWKHARVQSELVRIIRNGS